MIDCCECITRLTDRDAAAAYAYAGQIVEESRASDRWYPYLEVFAALLRHKNSLVRNRALMIVAANARWDTENQFDALLSEFLSHITAEKSITARQCIQVLPEIANAKPKLASQIRLALEHADLSGYRDSMQPLISKDIAAVLEQIP